MSSPIHLSQTIWTPSAPKSKSKKRRRVKENLAQARPKPLKKVNTMLLLSNKRLLYPKMPQRKRSVLRSCKWATITLSIINRRQRPPAAKKTKMATLKEFVKKYLKLMRLVIKLEVNISPAMVIMASMEQVDNLCKKLDFNKTVLWITEIRMLREVGPNLLCQVPALGPQVKDSNPIRCRPINTTIISAMRRSR